MRTALSLCLFTLERVRTMLLAVSLIVIFKLAYVLLLPAGLGA